MLRRWSVPVFAAALAFVQARACVLQWEQGFRPFGQPPVRVPLSWDMFAISIERCGLSWGPAVPGRGRTLSAMQGLAAPIEWDSVYNRREDYVNAGSVVCARRGEAERVQGQSFEVQCYGEGAKETHESYRCP